MLTVKALSSQKCFICGSTDKTVEVQFSDKTFRGVLCMNHVYEKLKQEQGESQSQAKTSSGAVR